VAVLTLSRKMTVQYLKVGARGSVVNAHTMLRAGRSQETFPMRLLNVFNLPKPYSRNMALGLSQPLVVSRQCGILNIKQPYKPRRPITGIALLYGDGVCFL
jgi:hypothetical protein